MTIGVASGAGVCLGDGIRLRAVTISATATTMTAPATSVRGSIGSCKHERSEDDRDDRVDVRVRRDQRQRRDAQQPAVRVNARRLPMTVR